MMISWANKSAWKAHDWLKRSIALKIAQHYLHTVHFCVVIIISTLELAMSIEQ